jgi:hypothetical protein
MDLAILTTEEIVINSFNSKLNFRRHFPLLEGDVFYCQGIDRI